MVAQDGWRLTWTPNWSSQGSRFSKAHSEVWPCSRLVASAISPQVTSTPKPLHTFLPMAHVQMRVTEVAITAPACLWTSMHDAYLCSPLHAICRSCFGCCGLQAKASHG